jgi:hypothetical protein
MLSRIDRAAGRSAAALALLAAVAGCSGVGPQPRQTVERVEQARAPTLVVTEDPLRSGGVAEVRIQGGAPNGRVMVDVDDGGLPTPRIESVEVVLDERGDGRATWNVPPWPCATFSSPGCETVTREID